MSFLEEFEMCDLERFRQQLIYIFLVNRDVRWSVEYNYKHKKVLFLIDHSIDFFLAVRGPDGNSLRRRMRRVSTVARRYGILDRSILTNPR